MRIRISAYDITGMPSGTKPMLPVGLQAIQGQSAAEARAQAAVLPDRWAYYVKAQVGITISFNTRGTAREYLGLKKDLPKNPIRKLFALIGVLNPSVIRAPSRMTHALRVLPHSWICRMP